MGRESTVLVIRREPFSIGCFSIISSGLSRTTRADSSGNNAHRGKVRKAARNPLGLRLAEEEEKCFPSKGWAAIIRKVYEVDPMLCPKCGGQMRITAFITDYQAVERIIDHLKLTFVAKRPPQVAYKELLMAAERSAEYFFS